MKDLIFLCVSSVPKSNDNFSMIMNTPEMQKLLNVYNVPFTQGRSHHLKSGQVGVYLIY